MQRALALHPTDARTLAAAAAGEHCIARKYRIAIAIGMGGESTPVCRTTVPLREAEV